MTPLMQPAIRLSVTLIFIVLTMPLAYRFTKWICYAVLNTYYETYPKIRFLISYVFTIYLVIAGVCVIAIPLLNWVLHFVK